MLSGVRRRHLLGCYQPKGLPAKRPSIATVAIAHQLLRYHIVSTNIFAVFSRYRCLYTLQTLRAFHSDFVQRCDCGPNIISYEGDPASRNGWLR